jgi:tetratricopeptide (TPR) repeat protein
MRRDWIALIILALGMSRPYRLEAQLGPLSSREHAPQAKSQEELDSYLRIISGTNPGDILRDAGAFLSQYGGSELAGTAYQYQMHALEQVGNYEGMLRAGQKALLANPDNLNTLLTLAPAIANRASEDAKESDDLALAEAYARRALDGIERVRPPRQTPLEKWDFEKRDMQCRAHEVLGVVALKRGLAAVAVNEFQLTVQLAPTAEGSRYFRLGLAYASGGDRSSALINFQRAFDLGPDAVRRLAQQEMKKLTE